ncbi:MAG: glycoside hydrolase family 19 protein [Rhizobiales bacterium]|nr:glycoside hydrolase family 19 protein [Hyphomicrobiales bacterium]
MTPYLLQACWGCTSQVAQMYAQPLTDAMARFGIGSIVRQAAFLAQVGHESGCGRYVREIWGPTPAQERYEFRADLGNREPGDGKRFMGRGGIQITGRYNYEQCGIALGLNLVAHPDLLEQPDNWALCSAWFWASHGCNEIADSGDFEALTRKINGGLNGLQDRLSLHKRATAALIMAGNTKAAPAPETQPAAPIIEAGHMADPIEVEQTIAERNPMPTQSSTFSDIGKTVGGVVSFANPFLGAAISALSGLIPEVAKLFPPGSEVAQRNVALASAVVDHVTQAVGAANAQDAVQRIVDDPAAAQSAQQAVQAAWFDLQEAGGGGIAGPARYCQKVAENAARRPTSCRHCGLALRCCPSGIFVVGASADSRQGHFLRRSAVDGRRSRHRRRARKHHDLLAWFFRWIAEKD